MFERHKLNDQGEVLKNLLPSVVLLSYPDEYENFFRYVRADGEPLQESLEIEGWKHQLGSMNRNTE